MDAILYFAQVPNASRHTFGSPNAEQVSSVVITDDADYTHEVIVTRLTTEGESHPFTVWMRDAHGIMLDAIADNIETAEARAAFLVQREQTEIEEDSLRPIKEEMEALAQERKERDWDPYGDDDL